MHKPDPVETILARLMPPGLSEQGQRDIEAMLDELAGPAVEMAADKPAPNHWLRRMIVGGIAAAGVAAAMIFPTASSPSPMAAASDQETPPEFVLVGESDRIESTTDEGWVENSDGTTMRALRLSVVEENSILDEETGYVMQVSEPREEILLMPVSAF
jgi:hypothetical protein